MGVGNIKFIVNFGEILLPFHLLVVKLFLSFTYISSRQYFGLRCRNSVFITSLPKAEENIKQKKHNETDGYYKL